MKFEHAARGIEYAKELTAEMLGEKHAAAMLALCRFQWGKTLPEWAVPNIPESGWAGFCCFDGKAYTIHINPECHSHSWEVAYTVGHELAHVLQDIMKGNMSHSGDIFKTFRNHFANEFGFLKKEF